MKALRKALSRKSKSDFEPSQLATAPGSESIITESPGTNLIAKGNDDPNISRSLSELNRAVTEFKHHYEQFLKKNQRFVTVDRYKHVEKAIEKAGKEQDINRSVKIFETEISGALRVMGRNQDLSKSKWVGKLGSFMTTVYPVARLSLRLTSAIADVRPQ